MRWEEKRRAGFNPLSNLKGDNTMPQDWGKKINHLEGWMESHPNSIVFAHLADCYLHAEDIERAIQICEDGLSKYPDYPSAYYVLAKCHMAKRQYEEAEKRLKKVLMLDPTYVRAHRRYGDLMIEIGWEKSGETSYKRVLEIDPLDNSTRAVMEKLQSAEIEDVQLEGEEESAADTDFFSNEQASFDDHVSPPDSIADEKIAPNQFDEVEEDLEEKPTEFEEEEERFSSILDDLFGSKMAEEEQKEEDTRQAIEKAAKLDQEKPDSPVFGEESSDSLDEDLTKNLSQQDDTDQPIADQDLNEKAEENESNLEFSEFTPEEDNLTADYGSDAFGVESDQIDENPFDSLDNIGADFEQNVEFVPEKEESTDDAQESNEPNEFADKISSEGENIYHETVDENEDMNQEFSLEDENEENIEDDELELGSVLEDLQESRSHMAPNEEIVHDNQSETEERTSDLKNESELKAESKHEHGEKILTPTLGEIFAAQGQYAKAISVFENLLKKDPDNPVYSKKIKELNKKLEENSD